MGEGQLQILFLNVKQVMMSQNGEVSAKSNAPLTSAQKVAASSASSTEIAPDAYGKEAKHFKVTRVLNRDVSKFLLNRFSCFFFQFIYIFKCSQRHYGVFQILVLIVTLVDVEAGTTINAAMFKVCKLVPPFEFFSSTVT